MRPDAFGLLGDSNGDLEEVPQVLGLLGLDISGATNGVAKVKSCHNGVARGRQAGKLEP